jgi:formylglycine-generating enzyme required for sulfatase activity
MLRKTLYLLILLSVLAMALLLNPQGRKLDTKLIMIGSPSAQFSKFDNAITPYLTNIKQDSTLLKSLSQRPKMISTNPLWVDKQEVQQADFYKFLGWIRVNPEQQYFAPTQPADWTFYTSSKTHGLSGRLGVSANGLSFYDAFAYCQVLGGRLPSADEFRRLAAGDKKSQLYPWGDEFNAEFWPYFDARLNATLKSGSFENGDTTLGIQDLGALLAEWTMGDYPTAKPFIQGGGAYAKPHELYALNMVYRAKKPAYRSPYVGFRCVYDKKPKTRSPWNSPLTTLFAPAKKLKINHYPHSKIRPLLHYLPRLSLSEFKALLAKNQQKNAYLFVSTNEISVAQYQRFLSDPFVKMGLYAHAQEPNGHTPEPLNWATQQTQQNRPVVGVDWWSAYHFANWVGGRLPSQDEFKKIQLSTPKSASIFKSNRQTHPDDVASDGQIRHLLGNVSEWTKSVDGSKENLNIVVSGGSFLIAEKRANVAGFYRSISPHHRAKDIGFRVVFSTLPRK